MKKVDLGQTVTILANIGVIAGIVFLGFELRQNNELLEAQANQAFVNNRISMNLARGEDGLAEAFVAGMSGTDLDPVDRFKLEQYYLASLAAWEWEFHRNQEGLLSDSEIPLGGWRYAFSAWPGLLDLWREEAPRRDPDFVEYFNANVVNYGPD